MNRITLIFCVACNLGGELAPTDKNVPPDVYDVHEWGLIDQSLVDGSLRLSAPSQPALGAGTIGLGLVGYGKPVLYFHVESGKRISLRASAGVTGEMRMVEHWPRTIASDTEVRWELELIPEPCDQPRSYPSATDAFCTRMSDGICETAELPEYETDDAACLIVDGVQWPQLLYRAAPVDESERPEEDARVELPLDVVKGLAGTIQVRNRSTTTSPLAMFRVTRQPSGTHVTRLDWPAPGETMTVTRATPDAESDGTSRESVREALSRQGLTDAEAEAFFRAWEDELWGAEEASDAEGETAEVTPGAGEALGLRGYGRGGGGTGSGLIGLGGFGIGRGGPVAPNGHFSDVLIYWLPSEVIDQLAPLTFEPAPRHVQRAMMVRVSLL